MSTPFSDVVVFFQGGVLEVEPDQKKWPAMQHSGPIAGNFPSLMYAAAGTRMLTARWYAAEFGSDKKVYHTPASVNAALQDVIAFLNAPGFRPGVVCIMGSSLGGRNAIDLGTMLFARGIPVAYIGLLDAALWDGDISNRPVGDMHPDGHGTPSNVPELKNPGPQDPNALRRNFYQTKGNWYRSHLDPFRPDYWVSGCFGNEVHGVVPGFESCLRDDAPGIRRAWGENDADIHAKAIEDTMKPQAITEINNCLDQLVANEIVSVPRFHRD